MCQEILIASRSYLLRDSFERKLKANVSVCARVCIWVHMLRVFCVHIEVRGQPWFSFLRCCPPFWRSDLTGLEFTG